MDRGWSDIVATRAAALQRQVELEARRVGRLEAGAEVQGKSVVCSVEQTAAGLLQWPIILTIIYTNPHIFLWRGGPKRDSEGSEIR